MHFARTASSVHTAYVLAWVVEHYPEVVRILLTGHGETGRQAGDRHGHGAARTANSRVPSPSSPLRLPPRRSALLPFLTVTPYLTRRRRLLYLTHGAIPPESLRAWQGGASETGAEQSVQPGQLEQPKLDQDELAQARRFSA